MRNKAVVLSLLLLLLPIALFAEDITALGGMRKVVLQKNLINGVNSLTQDMFCKIEQGRRMLNTNTVFVIQEDFTLSEDINVPDNSVLEFIGGSLKGGHTIFFSGTELMGMVNLEVNCNGTILNTKGYLSWFSSSSINSHNLNWLLTNCNETDIDRDIVLDAPINLGNHRVNLYSSNNSIIKVNCAPSFPYLSEFCSWIYSNNAQSVIIHDLTVDFDNKQFVYPSRNNGVRIANLFFVVSPEICDIHNISIKNYGGQKGKTQAYSFVGINIRTDGVSTVNLHDLIFENIKVIGDGNIGSSYAGFGECISVSVEGDSNRRVSPISINNISCKNCYSVNSYGKPFMDDFDCIYVGSTDKNERLAECNISNCYFENINKRGIKICCQNVNVDGLYYINPNRIEGMSVLVNPQNTNCTIKRVYAYPTTNCTVISSSVTRQFTVSDCVIIPSSVDIYVRGVSGCTEIRDCFFKNCYNPIVRAYTPEISEIIPGKFGGYRMDSETMQSDNVNNCVFENCHIIYDQLYSTIRTSANFNDCLFYNCLRFNTGEAFMAENCKFIRTEKSGIKGAFIETKVWKCYKDNNPSKKHLTPNTSYSIKLVLKDCVFDAGGNTAHLISSHLTDYNPLAVDVDLSVENCEIKNVSSGGLFISGDEGINFKSIIIKNTSAQDLKFRVQPKWTGIISLINSALVVSDGKNSSLISKELIFRNATFDSGKINLNDIFVTPSYNYIPESIFKGMPKAGTLYWQSGKPSWSNGSKWVDYSGKPI